MWRNIYTIIPSTKATPLGALKTQPYFSFEGFFYFGWCSFFINSSMSPKISALKFTIIGNDTRGDWPRRGGLMVRVIGQGEAAWPGS